MEIIWTRLAKITYIEIIENLIQRWTKKEVKNFNDLTNQILKKIQENKIEYPIINQNQEVRKVIIHKNVSLFYKKDMTNQKIYLITFFNNRMNPETLKKLLNK